MNITTTIEFKSVSEMFDKEQSGKKNNTVRFVDKVEDEKILSIIQDIKFIRIVNTDNTIYTSSFVRTLTDITRYINPKDLAIIYIFTWDK